MFIVTSAQIRRSIQKRLREAYPQLTFAFHDSMEEAESDLPRADILITYGGDVTEARLALAKQLKWMMVISAGLENLPLQAAKEQDIRITNVRGIHKIPMAEYTIGQMIATVKHMKNWHGNENRHRWHKDRDAGEITGQTLAVLGTGAIGTEIARLAQAFHMKTLGVNRRGRHVDFFDRIYTNAHMNECIAQADFVVAVLPYTSETEHFIGQEQFQAMKNEAIFINIGRGKTVQQEELLTSLRAGDIGHAVLDVFEEEPLPEDHPFWDMAEVTVTSHLSGITPKYQHRAFRIFEHNLGVFLSGGGDYMNQIDYERGY